MTQEQKARLYDETIEKLREFYRDYDTISCLIDVKEELANLFPEFKESEDERIRKALIKILNEIVIDTDYRELGIDYNIRDMIAWLEKQGKKLDPDKVIAWLDEHIPTKFEDMQNYVNQFKKDFGL